MKHFPHKNFTKAKRRRCQECNSCLFECEWLLKNLGTQNLILRWNIVDYLMPSILQYRLQYSSIMKNMAKVANKVTTIHSMTHGEAHTNEEHIICSQDTNLILRWHIQVSEQLYLMNWKS